MRHTFRKILAGTLAVAMVVQVGVFSKHETSDVQAVDNWKLVWSDEFNGTSLDTSVWSYEIGNGNWGWGNGEVQYYTNRTDNVRVSGGNLQIIAKKKIMVDRNIHQVELFLKVRNTSNMERWKPK